MPSFEDFVEGPDIDYGGICAIAHSIVFPHILRAVVLLDVPQILKSAGPGNALSASEICERIEGCTGGVASATLLGQALDVLVASGIFKVASFANKEQSPSDSGPSTNVKKYELTSVSQRLIKDESNQSPWSNFMLLLSSHCYINTFTHLHEAVKDSDHTPFETIWKKPFFQYLEQDAPDLQAQYRKTLGDLTSLTMKVAFDHYDEEFRNFRGRFLDLGGSNGEIVAVLAAKNDHAHFINFDRPEVVATAPPHQGVDHVGGNFLEHVPAADMIFTKYVLANWGDEDCLTILKNCFVALPANGKVIIMEIMLVDSYNVNAVGGLCVSVMGGCFLKGSKLRTVEDYRKLGKQAGFADAIVARTFGNHFLVELVKH